jgi:hypothetical protein
MAPLYLATQRWIDGFLAWREIGRETILLQSQASLYLGLDQCGRFTTQGSRMLHI